MNEEKPKQAAISNTLDKYKSHIQTVALAVVIICSFALFLALKADTPVPAIICFVAVTAGMTATMLI
nr:hypothetical protein [Anaerolineae bacterium]